MSFKTMDELCPVSQEGDMPAASPTSGKLPHDIPELIDFTVGVCAKLPSKHLQVAKLCPVKLNKVSSSYSLQIHSSGQ
jgi:hypothetical protein